MNLMWSPSSAVLLVLLATTVRTEPVIWAPFPAIPVGKIGNYTCQFEGQFVQWLVRVPGMALLSLAPGGNHLASIALAQYGIAMDALSSWILVLNASTLNNGTILQCTSFADKALLSQSVVVTVFDRPFAPTALNAIAIGEGVLELVWIPPFSATGVNISYTVLVSRLDTGPIQTAIGPLREPRYAYSWLGKKPLSCLQYQFTVVAGNDAGESAPSLAAVSSIPTVPQLGTLQSTVTSNKTDDFTITLSFNAARTCEDFPIEGYLVKVVNDITDGSDMKQIAPYTTSANGSYFKIAFGSSDGLQPNMRYTCSVWAYNAVGRSSPSSIVVYTTDVQSSSITGSDHQLNVTCFFAEGTLAKGCVVCLEKSGEVVYQMIPRVNGIAKGVIRTEFSVDCYNISVMDWEEDGSIGSQAVHVNVTQTLSQLNTCRKGDHGTQFQYLASIFTGVVGVTVILLAVVVILIIAVRHKVNGKRKFKICQDKLESDCANSQRAAAYHGSQSLINEAHADRGHSSRDNSTPMSSSTQTTAQSMLSVCSEVCTMV
ncbi:hypothetical protein EMCRGX_G012073 [Ephydatia muelleri]